MKQTSELDPLVLRNGSFDPRQGLLVDFTEGQDLALPHGLVDDLAGRYRMPTQRMLGDISDHERGDPFPRFDLSDRLPKIGFLKIVDVVLITGFEDGLQTLLDPHGRLGGERKRFEGFGQL
jgi:hypothetical protein